MKSFISRTFLNGVVAILPITLTLYALYWLGYSAESALGGVIRSVLPDEKLYWPGMGVAAGVAIVFLLGMLMNLWIIRKVFGLGEEVMRRIPFIKMIYGGLRDLMGFFTHDAKSGQLSQVALVRLDNGMRLFGLVTRDDLSDFPGGLGKGGHVAVYIPFSYQIGGYTAIMPRENLEPLDISVEEAMRFVVMAGMAGETERG